MKNLAGRPDCDAEIRYELTRARIEIVEGERSTHEVAASVTGKLGAFLFQRAWYYWMANGPMPIELARELYADPVGRTDVRAGGHCACPPPDEYGAVYYDADGKMLYDDPDGTELQKSEHFLAKGFITAEQVARYRFVSDRKAAAIRIEVDSYHIDSEVGLRLFADTIRRIGT